MRPAKYQHHVQDHRQQTVINGPRPSPLKINKESHLIQKPSLMASVGGLKQNQQIQKNHPVIIYTHSPKVIHTQARDFMALVQKLTGLSSSGDEQEVTKRKERGFTDEASKLKRDSNDDKESNSSSISTNENNGGDGGRDLVSPILNPPKNNYLGDIPLFTPNSTVGLFCSAKPLNWYRYSDSAMEMNRSSLSPSIMELMKGVAEY